MIKYDKTVREKGDTDIEKLQLILLEMLRVIDDICRRNDIEYWLDAGNLLGKVRHGGFIPWDDDIDLCMSRPDFDRFLEIAPKELPRDLFFQYKGTDKKKCKWVKIRDNYSTVIQPSEIDIDVPYHQGVFVDVFPYDVLVEDFSTTKMVLNRKFLRSKHSILRKFRGVFALFTNLPIKLIGYDRLKKYYIKKHMGDNPLFLSTGLEVSNFYFTFDYETVFPLKEIDFAGVKTFAPNNLHDYLAKMYGDYMVIPKGGDRHTHACIIKPFTKCDHAQALDY